MKNDFISFQLQTTAKPLQINRWEDVSLQCVSWVDELVKVKVDFLLGRSLLSKKYPRLREFPNSTYIHPRIIFMENTISGLLAQYYDTNIEYLYILMVIQLSFLENIFDNNERFDVCGRSRFKIVKLQPSREG